ncbi:hypothetical protein, partial [Streptomonospora sediminis]
MAVSVLFGRIVVGEVAGASEEGFFVSAHPFGGGLVFGAEIDVVGVVVEAVAGWVGGGEIGVLGGGVVVAGVVCGEGVGVVVAVEA